MAGKLLVQPVEMVAELRAARAAVLPVRREHEVIDDQPPAALEQLAERLPAGRRVEGIGLVDRRPGQGAAPLDDPRAQLGELLFLGQQRRRRRQPFRAGNDVVLHGRSPFQASMP